MDVAKVEATLKGELSWLQKHERLVLAVIAGLVLWFGIGKIDILIANHDNATLHQAQVVADQQAAVNAGLAQQAAYQAAQYKELAAQVAAQNAQLEAANVALSNALIKQQHVDATLPLPELAKRWVAVTPGVEEANIKATPTGITVDDAGARATVEQLETVPDLIGRLTNTQTELKNAQTLTTAEGQQIATLNTLVTGKDALLKDADKVCTEKIKTVKDAAAKSKRRWFIVGYVAGFLSRQYIKTATGL